MDVFNRVVNYTLICCWEYIKSELTKKFIYILQLHLNTYPQMVKSSFLFPPSSFSSLSLTIANAHTNTSTLKETSLESISFSWLKLIESTLL